MAMSEKQLYLADSKKYIFYKIADNDILDSFEQQKDKRTTLNICQRQEVKYNQFLKTQATLENLISGVGKDKENYDDFYKSIADFFTFTNSKLVLNSKSVDSSKITSAAQISLDNSMEVSLAKISQDMAWDSKTNSFKVNSNAEKRLNQWMSSQTSMEKLISEVVKVIANITGQETEIIEAIVAGYESGIQKDFDLAKIRSAIKIQPGKGKRLIKESTIIKNQFKNTKTSFSIENKSAAKLNIINNEIKESSTSINRAIISLAQIQKNAAKLFAKESSGPIETQKFKNDLTGFMNILAGWINQGGGVFWEKVIAEAIAAKVNLEYDKAVDEIFGELNKQMSTTFGPNFSIKSMSTYLTGTGKIGNVNGSMPGSKPKIQKTVYETPTADIAIMIGIKNSKLEGKVEVSPKLDHQLNISVKKINIKKDAKQFTLNLKRTTVQKALEVSGEDISSDKAYALYNLMGQRYQSQTGKEYLSNKNRVNKTRVTALERDYRKELAAKLLISAISGANSGTSDMCQLITINKKTFPISDILRSVSIGESSASAAIHLKGTNRWQGRGPNNFDARQRTKLARSEMLKAEIDIKSTLLKSSFG